MASDLVLELRRVQAWLKGWDPDEGYLLGNAADRIKELEAEVERLNRHRDELAADKHRLLLEIRGLDEEVERLTDANHKLDFHATALEAEVERLRDELGVTYDNLANADARVERLESELREADAYRLTDEEWKKKWWVKK